MATAVYFRQKAEQCRRLAGAITGRNDLTGVSLMALSVEFDAKAAALEAETAAAMTIGYGDDIGDLSRPSKGNGNSQKPE
jgi:hypothetical protein